MKSCLNCAEKRQRSVVIVPKKTTHVAGSSVPILQNEVHEVTRCFLNIVFYEYLSGSNFDLFWEWFDAMLA